MPYRKDFNAVFLRDVIYYRILSHLRELNNLHCRFGASIFQFLTKE